MSESRHSTEYKAPSLNTWHPPSLEKCKWDVIWLCVRLSSNTRFICGICSPRVVLSGAYICVRPIAQCRSRVHMRNKGLHMSRYIYIYASYMSVYIYILIHRVPVQQARRELVASSTRVWSYSFHCQESGVLMSSTSSLFRQQRGLFGNMRWPWCVTNGDVGQEQESSESRPVHSCLQNTCSHGVPFCQKDTESQSSRYWFVCLDRTGLAQSDAYDVFFRTVVHYVEFLCTDTMEAGPFLKALENFRATHKAGRDKIQRYGMISSVQPSMRKIRHRLKRRIHPSSFPSWVP